MGLSPLPRLNSKDKGPVMAQRNDHLYLSFETPMIDFVKQIENYSIIETNVERLQKEVRKEFCRWTQQNHILIVEKGQKLRGKMSCKINVELYMFPMPIDAKDKITEIMNKHLQDFNLCKGVYRTNAEMKAAHKEGREEKKTNKEMEQEIRETIIKFKHQ